MSQCICGNKEEYEACCGKFLDAQELATTALALMRSRYSAFVKKDAEYLNATSTLNIPRVTFSTSETMQWLGLKIQSFSDKEVTFLAYYKDDEHIEVMKEHSFFVINEGRLKYDSAKMLEASIERNELCPCGSGKKYKKCHG